MNVQRTAPYLLAAMIVIVLTMQARLLYVFPAVDSARWWGDETGQMLELRAELQDGHARIPTALGSSLEVTNGLVRGNSWAAALTYGVPALIFSNATDIVTIGRTITFLLSLFLCFAMYLVLRRLKIDSSLALLSILLLVSTRSFFYASHAARLDIAAGITVLGFVAYLSIKFEQLQKGQWSPDAFWCFWYGSVAVLSVTLSIHLLTLIGALSLFILWRFGLWRNVGLLASMVGGFVLILLTLIGIYAISGAPMTLFSESAKPNQFQSVATMLPILRPFSRSVQVANILERVTGLWSEAPALLLLCALALTARVLFRKPKPYPSSASFWNQAAIVLLIAWLFFQSPALYYYMHILPVLLISLMILISESTFRNRPIIVVAVGLILFIFGVRDTVTASSLARRIDFDNINALNETVRAIGEDGGWSPYILAQNPAIFAQNPAINRLEHSPNVTLVTPHFLDFPLSLETPAQTIHRLGIQYLVLYAPADGKSYSTDYATLRPISDSIGFVRMKLPGIYLDAKRDYFSVPALSDSSAAQDTLLLYRVAR